MTIRFCDEFGGGFGWITDDKVARTSHVLSADGGVWLVDPVAAPGVEERFTELGEPRGVIQLVDRHARDGAALAARLGVQHHVVPFGPVAGAPFELVPLVRLPVWREAALWYPDARVLVCGDALGTLPYFRARGEPLGVHPLLRLVPPRSLARLEPMRVLVGHGEGLHGSGAAPALQEALATARRRAPALALATALGAAGGLAARLRR